MSHQLARNAELGHHHVFCDLIMQLDISPSGAPSLNPRAGAQDLVWETSAPKCLMNPIQVVFCCCPMNSIHRQRQYVAQKFVKASRSSLGISASGKLQKKTMSTYVKPLNFIFLHHLRVTSYRLGQPHEF